MAKEVNLDCKNCDKLINCCCKSCFNDHEHNIFNSLLDKELDFLIDEKKQIHYSPGETIVKQNTATTYVICVKEGLAKLYIEGEKGKNLLVRLIGSGDFITGGGLFNGNIQHFTITAVTNVKCCLIDSSKIAKLFSENNKFAVDLLRHHARHNNNLLSKLVDLTQKYMPGRVADTLLYLKNDIYKINPFKIDLSRQDLADMSNMTKESFVRILQEFKTSEIIKTKGNTLEIIDEGALASVSKNG